MGGGNGELIMNRWKASVMQDEVLELCCTTWSYREQCCIGERVDLLLQDNKIKLKNKQVRLLMSPCSPDRIQAQPPVGGDIGFS